MRVLGTLHDALPVTLHNEGGAGSNRASSYASRASSYCGQVGGVSAGAGAAKDDVDTACICSASIVSGSSHDEVGNAVAVDIGCCNR